MQERTKQISTRRHHVGEEMLPTVAAAWFMDADPKSKGWDFVTAAPSDGLNVAVPIARV
jgi:hypothetical protein